MKPLSPSRMMDANSLEMDKLSQDENSREEIHYRIVFILPVRYTLHDENEE